MSLSLLRVTLLPGLCTGSICSVLYIVKFHMLHVQITIAKSGIIRAILRYTLPHQMLLEFLNLFFLNYYQRRNESFLIPKRISGPSRIKWLFTMCSQLACSKCGDSYTIKELKHFPGAFKCHLFFEMSTTNA